MCVCVCACDETYKSGTWKSHHHHHEPLGPGHFPGFDYQLPVHPWCVCVHVISHTKVLPGKVITIIMHLEDLNTSLDLITSSPFFPAVCVRVMSHTKVLPGKVITIIMHLEDLNTSLDLIISSPSIPDV